MNLLNDPGNVGERIEIIKGSILPAQEARPGRSSVKIKRSIKKWMMMFFVSSFVLVYMAYFWIFALLRGKMLLGGRKHAD